MHRETSNLLYMNNKIEPAFLKWTSGKVKGFCAKELIHLENGSLKLIKIDPFAIYPEHMHPDKNEYVYVLEGNPEFAIDNELYKGRPGDFFIFPQKTNHNISNPTELNCTILVGAFKSASF
jgi:quercetin dioxygenase-like cupin family protein